MKVLKVTESKGIEVLASGLEMTEAHFIETSWGVSCSKFFSFSGVDPVTNESMLQDFIVLGYEDGSIHVYDYTRYFQ